MKRIRIDIRTENDAFQCAGQESVDMELACILSNMAREAAQGRYPNFLYDSNGKTTGNVTIT